LTGPAVSGGLKAAEFVLLLCWLTYLAISFLQDCRWRWLLWFVQCLVGKMKRYVR